MANLGHLGLQGSVCSHQKRSAGSWTCFIWVLEGKTSVVANKKFSRSARLGCDSSELKGGEVTSNNGSMSDPVAMAPHNREEVHHSIIHSTTCTMG